jgi:hypothetical protein
MLVEQDVQIDRIAVQQTLVDSRTIPENPARLPLERQSAVDALLRSCRVGAKEGHWADVERIASTAAATYAEESCFHTQWAWAAHRQGRTIEALHIVEKVAHRFPRSVGVAYTLACLNGALHRVTPARQWLSAAIERASNPGKVKLRSLRQAELQPLWSDEREAAET